MTNVTQIIKFVFHTVENIVGKGGNADSSFFPVLRIFLRVIKCLHFVKKVNFLANNFLDWFKLKAFAGNKRDVT